MKVDAILFKEPERMPKSGITAQNRDFRASDGWDIDLDTDTGIVAVNAAGEDKAFLFGPSAWRRVELSKEEALTAPAPKGAKGK